MGNNHHGRNLRERLLSRLIIEPETGCLIWPGACNSDGYGHMFTAGRPQHVHRLMYEMFSAPVPAGMELDHLCRVRHCASPAHLEPVTHAENNRRAAASRKAVA